MFSRQPLWDRLSKAVLGSSKRDTEAAASLAAAKLRPMEVKEVHMDVENGGPMAIGVLPTFRYHPQWSPLYRTSVGKVVEVQGQRLRVEFSPSSHRTPPMAWFTTFLQAFWPLPVPALPPGVTIEIRSSQLNGWIDLETGIISLYFVSTFENCFMGQPLGRGEPLQVASEMGTEVQEGRVFHAAGRRLRESDARATLVALSRVPKTKQDWVQNAILQLPTDALSVLPIQLRFVA